MLANRIKIALLLMLFSLFLFGGSAPATLASHEAQFKAVLVDALDDAAPASSNPQHVPNQVILKLEGDADRERLVRVVEPLGVKVEIVSENLDLFVLDLPRAIDIPALSDRLAEIDIVAYAEPNTIYKATASLPNDTFFRLQWGLDNTGQVILGNTGTPDADIDAPEAWGITTGAGAVVAIVDTGVDWAHPDLAANIWQNPGETGGGKETNGVDDDLNGKIDDFHGWDTVTAGTVGAGEDPGPPDNNPMDVQGHGTHVAGIAAAVTDNSTGTAGVSGDSQIMAVRAGFKTPSNLGSFVLSDVVSALDYAVENGADVINLSLGSTEPAASLETACNDAVAQGVAVVAASGNGGSNSVLYPAAYDSVIAVGATDNNDNLASFSDYGPEVDVSAPGVSIGSTYPRDETGTPRYVYMDGTSMATPMVAGAVALLRSLQPAISPANIKAALESTADDLGAPGRDDFFGHGRINAYAAVASIADTETPTTSVETSPTTADGQNGWFITNPAITLSANETATTAYSWDTTLSPSTYTVPFNVPTDGVHDLFYFSVDTAGNTETIQSSAFKVDTGLPVDPTQLVSVSHTTGTPSGDNTIDMGFSGATDTASGVAGYSLLWSSESTAPVSAVNKAATGSATETTTSIPLADGAWWFNLSTKDNAGHWTSTAHLGPFVIDTQAPATSIETTSAADPVSGWFSNDAIVTLSSDEPGDTYYRWNNDATQTYSGPFSAIEGRNSISYWSVDGAGNIESGKQATVRVDMVNPVNPTLVSASVTGTVLYKTIVEVMHADATDAASGVDGFSVTWSPGATATPPATVNVTADATTTVSPVLSGGLWFFNLRTSDVAGHWSESRHTGPFVIETDSPVTALAIDPIAPDGSNGWYKSAPGITLAPDETAATFYYWNVGPVATYTVPLSPPAQGLQTLYYYSVDSAGNTETPVKKLAVSVDTIKPAASLTIDAGAAHTNTRRVTLTIGGADGGSGLGLMRLRNTGGAWTAWEAYSATRAWILPAGDGSRRIEVEIKDAAGNISAVAADTIFLDQQRPRVSLVTPFVSTRISKSTTFKVKWGATDPAPASGVANYTVRVRSGGSSTWTNWKTNTRSTTGYFRGRAGRTYYFRVKAFDRAGNVRWSPLRKTIVPYNEGALIRRRVGFNGFKKKNTLPNYLSSVRYSYTRGNTIVYKFIGNSVGLISTKGTNYSRAKIYIDGKHVRTIDTHSSRNRPRQLVFYRSWPKVRTHYLKVVNLGTPGRSRFDVDGLAVGR